jgi:tetratricopeptide (TPR) repeat protein
MDAKIFAIGGVTAGLLFAGWGVFVRDDSPAVVPVTASAVESLVSEQPTNGLRSIEEIVSFWTDRVTASPLGYLDRTQLGLALAAQARENADLAGYEVAEGVLREALVINPAHASARIGLAQSLHSQHRFSEARMAAAEVLDENWTLLSALALLGDANLELGNYAEAQRLYDELALQERSAPVVSRLSRLAYFRGDVAASAALAEEALELGEQLALRPSERAFYFFQLGHSRFVTGDVDGAIESLERAREVSPGHPAATEELAFVLASAGRASEAEELYVELISTGPAADLHGSYADLLRARGEVELADDQDRFGMLLALETIDRFPAERRHLASFFGSRDTALAVQLAEQDVAERRDVGAYDTLAWALYLDGQFDTAEAAIDSALASGVQDAAIYYHAAAIAAANGDGEEARVWVDSALAINPRFHPSEAFDAAALKATLG